VNPAKYIWPSEVWDNSIWYCQIYVKQVSGNDTACILKFTIPHKTYDASTAKYAKYVVVPGDTNSFFDDTLNIRYFNTQAEAEAGMVSGDITTNFHYYEFLRKLPTDDYNEMPKQTHRIIQ
jgi:hypothetical protein